MVITVNSPKIRTAIRQARQARAAGRTKANIQNFLDGSKDVAGSSAGAGVEINPIVPYKSAERTLILADVPA